MPTPSSPHRCTSAAAQKRPTDENLQLAASFERLGNTACTAFRSVATLLRARPTAVTCGRDVEGIDAPTVQRIDEVIRTGSLHEIQEFEALHNTVSKVLGRRNDAETPDGTVQVAQPHVQQESVRNGVVQPQQLVADVVGIICDHVGTTATKANLAALGKTWATGIGGSIVQPYVASKTINMQEVSAALGYLFLNNTWAMGHIEQMVACHGSVEVAERLARNGRRLVDLCMLRANLRGVARLGHLPQLRRLELNMCQLNERAMHHLGLLSQLECLRLQACSGVSDAGLVCLGPLLRLQALHLSLGYQTADQVTDEGLLHLCQLPKLEALGLAQCNSVTERGIGHLERLPQLQSVEFAFCHRCLTEAGFAKVGQLSHLRKLSFFRCTITPQSVAHLRRLSELRSLFFQFCFQVTERVVREVGKLSQLHDLKLSSCEHHVTDAALAGLATLTQLRTLSISHCYSVTDNGLAHIGQLPQLQSVDVTGCSLTKDGVARFLPPHVSVEGAP